ncbi:MAG: T9SS type A sorting domain-containing protein [Rhodothermales bacterium]|nr:T9SS type A sorting domain-containing protein [Rhodothermales bacterium]MBO6778564.1 T9SS type A sorting domain-containing protein [Rhodothermales bacterium]
MKTLYALLLCGLLVPAAAAQKVRISEPEAAELTTLPARSAAFLSPPRNFDVRLQGSAALLSWEHPESVSAPELAEIEPNNRLEEAQRLYGPAPAVVTGAAQISDTGQLSVSFEGGAQDDFEDLYVFDLLESGGTVVLSDLSEDCDVYLLGESGTGLQIVGESLNIGTLDETIRMDTLSAGTYLVGVSIFDPSLGAQESDYRLTVSGAVAAESVTGFRVYRSDVVGARANGEAVVDVGAEALSASHVLPGAGTWHFQVVAVGASGESAPSNEVSVIATGIEPIAPRAFRLEPVAPNPVRGQALISFELGHGSPVRVQVVDMLGRVVARPLAEFRGPGIHEVPWDASGHPTGTYLVMIQTDTGGTSKPLIHVR